MNNKCINLKIRSKKGIKYEYCIKFKKEVSIFCKCKNIEYKQYFLSLALHLFPFIPPN